MGTDYEGLFKNKNKDGYKPSAPVSCSTAQWRELAEASLAVSAFMALPPSYWHGEWTDEDTMKYHQASERLKNAIKNMKPYNH